jgi:hypothetical protein
MALSLEPSERCGAERGIDHQRPLEVRCLRRRDAREGLLRLLASLGATGDGGALDDRGGWQDDVRAAQRPDNGGRDRDTRIGALGRRCRYHEGQVGRRGWTHPQRRDELPRMVRHGLGTLGVLRQGTGLNVQPLCHPGHQWIDRLAEIGKRRTRVTQQRKLHGVAEAAGVIAAFGHELPVGPRQGEAAVRRSGSKGKPNSAWRSS